MPGNPIDYDGIVCATIRAHFPADILARLLQEFIMHLILERKKSELIAA